MSRDTEAGKYYHLDDEELPWVYAYSSDSGGIFGLDMNLLPTSVDFRKQLLAVHYGKHIGRIMSRNLITKGPLEVAYVESPGDGSSHGATWRHFAELTRGVSDRDTFRRLDDRTLELQLDGLENMAIEGARREGGGWSVIHEGLADARTDLYEGKGWRQEQLFVGLGWMARSFAEREEAAMQHAMAA